MNEFEPKEEQKNTNEIPRALLDFKDDIVKKIDYDGLDIDEQIAQKDLVTEPYEEVIFKHFEKDLKSVLAESGINLEKLDMDMVHDVFINGLQQLGAEEDLKEMTFEQIFDTCTQTILAIDEDDLYVQ